MYQSERMLEILKILKKYHYVTVDYLVKEIKYSPASIRRDLTMLENQGLVKRSYGGVEIKSDTQTPFEFRQHSMKIAKNSIASYGAKLVKNGDTVFIDGSTSAQYLGHFLVGKKDLTVVTNNMLLASYLNEHGITAYCTGGIVNEIPGILVGEITNNSFAMFHADIMFFSTYGCGDGCIYENDERYYQQHKTMLANSDKSVYLCGSDKIGKKSRFVVTRMEKLDYFITDGEIDEFIQSESENTIFIKAR